MPTKNSLPYFDENNNMKIPLGTKLKAVMSLDSNGYKDNFIFQFSYSKHLLRKLKTITAHRTYQQLLYLLATDPNNRNGSTVYATQVTLGIAVGCATPEISKAIKELTKVGIIIEHKRGKITINPKCAWNGKLRVWQEACENIAVQELEDAETI